MAGYDRQSRKRKNSNFDGSQRGAPHQPPFNQDGRDNRFGSRDNTPRRPNNDRRASGRGPWTPGGNEGRGGRQQPGQRTPRTRSPNRNQHVAQQQATPTPSGPPRQNTQQHTSSVPQTPTQQPIFSPMELRTTEPSSPTTDIFEIWDYVTPTRCRDWNSSGEAEVLSVAKDALEAGDITKLCEIYAEIIKAGAENRISPQASGAALASITQLNPPPDTQVDLVALLLSSFIPYEQDQVSQNVIAIIRACKIADATLASNLDASTIVALGLAPEGFARKVKRAEVNHFYKQQKYNLLREETEGYAKIISELFSASYNPNWIASVDQTLDNIKSLIGAFELDPSRVLDVLLDMFACNLVANFRFYVKLLQASPWWPSGSHFDFSENLMELDEESKVTSDKEFFEKLRTDGISAFFNPTSAYSSYPNKGNSTAAQLLGFKFRLYHLEDVRESTPENLVFTAALLIRIGFISIADLYPHLGPDDAEIEKELPAFQKKMQEKAGKARLNALAMAGALGDDPSPPGSFAAMKEREKAQTKTPEPTRPKEKEKEKKGPTNQKILLLISLLGLGAIPESLFILGKFPFLPGPFPEIADHLHRIIHHSISPVFDPLLPPIVSISGQEKEIYGQVHGQGIIKQQRTAQKVTLVPSVFWRPTSTLQENIDYRFYWEDWTEGIPVCRSAEDVVTLCDTILKLSGVRLNRDAKLMSKLARIGAHDIETAPDEARATRLETWSRILREHLLPAMYLVKSNTGLSHDLWALLSHYSTMQRYSFYGEWMAVSNGRTAEGKCRISEAEKETKDLLKRISKTNVKQMARALAKIATGAPGTVFQVALGQIESYDNLVDVVVDAARYFSSLGYDVLTYSLLVSLGNENKGRMQSDGLVISKWLQTLSVFCGKVFRKYPTIDPTPILEYVVHQLRKGNTVDLVILKEIITAMAGIVTESNLSETTLQALAGKETLRSLALVTFQDRRNEREAKASGKRLVRCLSNADLIAQLLILIAQQRQTCVYNVREEDAHLKLLGNIYDEIHTVLAQYIDLLRFQLQPADYAQKIPMLDELCLKYGIDPAIAWWISRPWINQQVRLHDKKKKEEEAASKASEEPGDVAMSDVPTATAEEETAEAPTPVEEPSSAADTPAQSDSGPFHPVLLELAQSIRPVLPESVWDRFSLPFYVTFWHLAIDDIFVPTKSYEMEMSRIQAAIKREQQSNSRDRDRPARIKTLQQQHGQLAYEVAKHLRMHMAQLKRMKNESSHWFEGKDPEDVAKYILQYCIMPRVFLSPNDAIYCAKFLRETHKINPKNFSLHSILDALFGPGMATTIFMCSQREAENYGKFLNEVLNDLEGWHAKSETYEKQALLPGGNGFLNKAGKPIDFEDFRRDLYNWHRAINNALKICFESNEAMQIKNAIVVQSAIYKHFPAVKWMGLNILAKLETLKSEKREDLKIAAMTLSGQLRKRERQWKETQEFQKGNAIEEISLSAKEMEDDKQKEKQANGKNGDLHINTQKIIDTITGRAPPSAREIEDGEIPDSATATSAPVPMATSGSTSTSVSAPQVTVTVTPSSLPPKPTTKPLPPKPNITPRPRDVPLSQANRVSNREHPRDSRGNRESPSRVNTPPRTDQPVPIRTVQDPRDINTPPRGPQQYVPPPMSGSTSHQSPLPYNPLPVRPSGRPSLDSNWTPENRHDRRDTRDTRDIRDSRGARERDPREGRLERPESRQDSTPDRRDLTREQRRNMEKPAHIRDERPKSRDGSSVEDRSDRRFNDGGQRNDRNRDSSDVQMMDAPPLRADAPPFVPTHGTQTSQQGGIVINKDREQLINSAAPQPIPTLETIEHEERGRDNWSRQTHHDRFGHGRRSPSRRDLRSRASDSNLRNQHDVPMRDAPRPPSQDMRRREEQMRPPSGPRADIEQKRHEPTARETDRERQERDDERERAAGSRDMRAFTGGTRGIPTGPSHPHAESNQGRLSNDFSHGRLNNDFGHGRLNAPESASIPSSNNIPSGPRGGRGPHHGQQQHFGRAQNIPSRGAPTTGPNNMPPLRVSQHNVPNPNTLPSPVIDIKPTLNTMPPPDAPRPTAQRAPSPKPQQRAPSPPAATIHPSRLAILGDAASAPASEPPSGPSHGHSRERESDARNPLSSTPTAPSSHRGRDSRGGDKFPNRIMANIQADLGGGRAVSRQSKRGGTTLTGLPTPAGPPAESSGRRGSGTEVKSGPSTPAGGSDRESRNERHRDKDEKRHRSRSRDRERDRGSRRESERGADSGSTRSDRDSRRGSERGTDDRGDRERERERTDKKDGGSGSARGDRRRDGREEKRDRRDDDKDRDRERDGRRHRDERRDDRRDERGERREEKRDDESGGRGSRAGERDEGGRPVGGRNRRTGRW